MFWKKDEKFETLKDLVGSRAAYIETVKMLELKGEEKDIFLRATIEVKKNKPNQEIIDRAYTILIGKSYQGKDSLDEENNIKDVLVVKKVKDIIGTSSTFMEFINKYNPKQEERAILSGAHQSLKKEPYDMQRMYAVQRIINKYILKEEKNDVYISKTENTDTVIEPVKNQCTNCGATLKKDANFCNACGAPVNNEPSTISKPEPVKNQCTNCGATLKKDANFCNVCGTPVNNEPSTISKPEPVKNQCSSCGAILKKDAKFCNVCGTPVKDGINNEAKVEPDKNLCQNCSAKLKDNAKFCNACGTPVK